jgi:hypothetical protein
LAIRKYLARDHKFFVSEDGRATWIAISGIATWGFTIDNNDEDVSTVDNGGWGSSMYTQHTGALSLEGFFLVDAADGTRDQGQLKTEQAATKVGYDAYRDFKIEAWPTISGVQSASIGSIIVTGTPALGDMGGAVTDVDPWNVEVAIDGKPTGSGIYDIF